MNYNIMNRNEICHSCQIEDVDEEEQNARIEFTTKINELIDEADTYAISVWSELSRHQQSEWANYIGKLRTTQFLFDKTEFPKPPKRLDTLKM
tara:strand:- start:147 stop:425 length:279 start_codon:yes stop_codon:yes gene_type:complete